MNREILFKGKCIRTDEWVYGYLSNSNVINSNNIRQKVNPKTVGQYTGLKDKNGVKIFEGDIVECVIGLKYAVVFSSYANFGLKPFSSNVKNIEYQSIDNIYSETSLLVIGNIHDK